MKTYVFRNADNSVYVEYLVDYIGDAHNFTVMQIRGLDEAEKIYGFVFRELTNTLSAFKTFATDNNLILEDRTNDELTGEVSATTLVVATASLPEGVTSDAEVTEVTIPAEEGVKESTTITLPSTAGATQGDYFTYENAAGVKYAAWLDIDADGTAPTGAEYVAATNKIEVDIVTAETDAQVAAKVKAAIEADGSFAAADLTITDNVDGTLTLDQDNIGVTTDPVPHDASDSGAGSVTILVDTEGVDSTLDGTYWTLNSDDTEYYVWNNVDGADNDPAVGGKTGIEVAMSGAASANTVATATAAAIDAVEDFTSGVPGAAVITVINADKGVAVDAADVDAGVSVEVTEQGTDAVAYSQTLTSSGGNGTKTWSIDSGALPDALSLNSASGAITGTPTVADTFEFTVKVEDSFTSATKALSILITS